MARGVVPELTANEFNQEGVAMGSLSALFVGGTGKISSACVERAIEIGFDVSVLNRNQTSIRPLPKDVTRLSADIRDVGEARRALGDRHFDVVADFTVFDTAQVLTDIEIFEGRAGQFVFISSASAYQKPVARLPITESTPLVNPYWEYSRNKIACEERLLQAHRLSIDHRGVGLQREFHGVGMKGHLRALRIGVFLHATVYRHGDIIQG